jgi:hypothetical protein
VATGLGSEVPGLFVVHRHECHVGPYLSSVQLIRVHVTSQVKGAPIKADTPSWPVEIPESSPVRLGYLSDIDLHTS